MTTRNIREKLCRDIFFLLYCCICLCGATTANCANIIAFGDSITEGKGSSTGGYPPKLSSLLKNNNKPSTVANFGSGGEQTPQGISRFDSVLASSPANFILIMEGTNDADSGISVQTTQHNLQAMINKSRAAGVTPLLATLTPSDLGSAETLIPQTWNPMIKALAGSNGITLADQYAAVLPNWGSLNVDGTHPNDSGYQVLANTWFLAVAPKISTSGAAVASTSAGGSSGGGGGGGACFIATAAFGSPVEKHVRLLKKFRDSYLLTNYPGQQFVRAYYHYSPPVADFIRQHATVKLVVRMLLYPLVALCYIVLKLTMPLRLALATLVTIGLTLAAVAWRNKRKSA